MGLISDFVASKKIPTTGLEQGIATWQQVFAVSKEDGQRPVSRPVPGGTYGRSLASGDASVKRLLQAMRSMAPGGWSDNRWEQTRHFKSIAYICIHRAGEQLMGSEFALFRKDPSHPDGKRPVTPDDPPEGNRIVKPYDLIDLLEKPNPDDSYGDLMYQINQQMDLTGMSLMWMVPNKLGVPFELYPVPTAIAIPQPAVNPDFPDGYYRIQPIYPYGPFSSYPTPNSAIGAPIPAQWMLRFKYHHPLLKYDGFSPQTALQFHLDEIEMIDRSRHYSMRRGIHPSAVLNFDEMEGAQPLPEPEIARIKAEFEETQMGPENYGNLFVATPGAKLEEWGNRPVDMEYQSGWMQLVDFAMAGFGTSKAIAGMVGDSSYSTLFASLKQFHLLTLQPKCVAGSTPLITRDGAGPIADFVNKEVDVWNGKKWSNVTVRKTGEDQSLVRVRFSDGSYLDCTPNHRFSVNTKNNRSRWEIVEAKDLQQRMATESFVINHDIGDGLKNAYTLGVLLGDGQVKAGNALVTLFGEKKKLPIEGAFGKEQQWKGVRVPCVTVNCGKLLVPRMEALRADNESAWWEMFSFDRSSILQFLAGWLDTDGSNQSDAYGVRLYISGCFKADKIQLLLTKCGIRSTVGLVTRAGTVTNYGRRQADLYYVQITDCTEIPCHRLDTSRGRPAPRKGKYQTVRSVDYLPGLYDTYCFTESDEHKGVFNNTLTHQCNRIAAKLTRHLAPFFGDDLILEIRCPRIDDHEVRHVKMQTLMEARAVTKNEMRREFDLPLTDEEWGGELAGVDTRLEKQVERDVAMAQEGEQMGIPPEKATTRKIVAAAEENQQDPDERKATDQMENHRPRSGKVGVGALGPRKFLDRFSTNGNGRHT